MNNRRLALQAGVLLLAEGSLGSTHAGQGRADFYPPVQPRPLVFPKDHGAHLDFRTEWWYLTGWLWREQEAVGFQLTFFRSRTQHPSDNPSRLAPKQLLFAHAAISKAKNNVFMHANRAARLGGSLYRSETNDTDLQLEDWTLRRVQRGGQEMYEGQFSDPGFSMSFQATPSSPVLLRGRAGYSQKGPQAQQASYYYSRAPMKVTAQVQVGSQTQAMVGQAWLDHEWSSQLLMPGAVGWDWLGINLLDGGTLMAFQIRDAQSASLYSHVDARDAKGLPVAAWNGLQWQGKKKWRSQSLIEYPIPMDLQLGGVTYQLVPLMLSQEVDARASTGGHYWEGAVSLIQGERLLGHGYLELTGYGEPLVM